jgi:Mannosylglycerate hydrolase MGH1-like glycoside hydrolase domain
MASDRSLESNEMSAKSENKSTLLEQAKAVLEDNDRGSFTVPASELYPHQWLWDSCFISMGLRHFDVERAKMEILNLLRAQWNNGMVPSIIFTEGNKPAMHHGIWNSWVSPDAPDDILTSGITQPPMIAEAVVQIGKKMELSERRSWYRLVWPALLAYHEWLYRERDPHDEGLVLQIHPWETGLDNTPPWMGELHKHLLPWWIRFLRKTRLEVLLSNFRRDTRIVPAEQRYSNIDALAFFAVQRRLLRKAYDINKILDHSLFTIEDLTFNSIFIRANEHLAHIAKSIREELPEDLKNSMGKTRKTFEELWDPYSEQYYSRDFVTHRLLKEPSIAAFMPLYAGCISDKQAKLLVKMLENEHMFGPAYPVPSVPVNSPWFQPKSYWQGPTWINTNWLVIDGLKRCGFENHAAALSETTLELVEKNGMYEYFDPLNGEPAGIKNFSWTAALTIDLLKTAKR